MCERRTKTIRNFFDLVGAIGFQLAKEIKGGEGRQLIDALASAGCDEIRTQIFEAFEDYSNITEIEIDVVEGVELTQYALSMVKRLVESFYKPAAITRCDD
jgi:hypothetical protein